MRTLYVDSVNSAHCISALVQLACCLAAAFFRMAHERDFEPDPMVPFRFQLINLLAATFYGRLSPQDWDVRYYYDNTKLRSVKLALEPLLPQA